MPDLSRKEFPKTWQAIDSALADGTTPGLVAGFWSKKNPEKFFASAVGERRRFPSSLPMEIDTVFDLSSLTKIVGTATLATVLVERGWLTFDTPLGRILSEYPFAGEITIAHLLAHTAGFEAWEPLWEKIRDRFAPKLLSDVSVHDRQRAMRELVFSVKPDFRLGEKALYSDISFLLLGFALEEITQLPIDRAIRDFVWKPMGLRGFYFRPLSRRVIDEKVAATEDSQWRGGILQGEVHDDNTWAMGGYGGHSGAFGRAQDVLEFARKMMTGFFPADLLKKIWTRVGPPVGPSDCSRTLGWDTPSGESTTARGFPLSSVGHLGFTGTSLWIDHENGIAVTLLSNRVHPTRENNQMKMRAFRAVFHEAIHSEILKFSSD